MKTQQSSGAGPRRTIGNVNILGTTQMYLRNPYVIAFWSVMFPGFGHILLSKYLRGYILFVWEIVINIMSHVNMAIFYTLIGKFEDAKASVDIRWSLLYIPTFLFAVWDSYRTTIDLNNHFILALREGAPIKPFALNVVEINYLDKTSPLVTTTWSMLMPGLGQVMIHRIVSGGFFLGWWIAVMYMSNYLTALNFTFLGEFERAGAVLELQWFLDIPSLYFFSAYVAYVNTVESNNLFNWEQSKFFEANYQSPDFLFPAKKRIEMRTNMYLVSTFKHSIYIEKAISALEQAGLPKKDIFAVSLQNKKTAEKLFDTKESSNGQSVFDLPMILGSVFMLLGCIYGFLLRWGPVIWGILGAFIGFGIGLLIKILITKNKKEQKHDAEVVVLIDCEESKAEIYKRLLWQNGALGVNLIKGGG